MGWVILLVSAVLEAVWATALGLSEGLSRPVPTVVFLVFCVLSLVGLAQSMRTIPIGTAYAVWTGLGAVLTVLYAVATGTEPLTPLKALFLAGIIGCAVGLKFTTPAPQPEAVAQPGADRAAEPGAAPVAQPAADPFAGQGEGARHTQV